MDIQKATKNPENKSKFLSDSERAKLYWQCRRGMLELDLLLQGFFHSHIDTLAEDDISTFTELLDCADNQLLEYLMGRVVPSDKRIANVVSKIRSTAKHST
jgi:antitoxin CptB